MVKFWAKFRRNKYQAALRFEFCSTVPSVCPKLSLYTENVQFSGSKDVPLFCPVGFESALSRKKSWKTCFVFLFSNIILFKLKSLLWTLKSLITFRILYCSSSDSYKTLMIIFITVLHTSTFPFCVLLKVLSFTFMVLAFTQGWTFLMIVSATVPLFCFVTFVPFAGYLHQQALVFGSHIVQCHVCFLCPFFRKLQSASFLVCSRITITNVGCKTIGSWVLLAVT